MSNPTNKVEGYETIHKKGSRFGQDLTEAGVEALLKGGGGGSNPIGNLVDLALKIPGGLVNLVLSIPTTIIDGLTWAANQLWGETKDVPYPESPSFTAIPEKLQAALAPLKQILDENIQLAESATQEAEGINQAMRNAFANGEGYSGDLQLQWNTLVNNTDKSQNASIKALEDSDEALRDANKALSIAAMRSGRICFADRQTRVQDGFVKIDNPAGSATAYVSLPPASQLKEKWYGTITAITQFESDHPRIRSCWVENGVMKGSSGNTIDSLVMRTGGFAPRIEHTIAIYTQMTPEVFAEFKLGTKVTQL